MRGAHYIYVYRIIGLSPITLSGKKYMLSKVYVLNKQVSKYVVMMFFLSKTLVLTGYGFVLSCKQVVHVALPH